LFLRGVWMRGSLAGVEGCRRKEMGERPACTTNTRLGVTEK
jgi:hypothetical protein